MQALKTLKPKVDRWTEMSDFTNNMNLKKSVRRHQGIDAASDLNKVTEGVVWVYYIKFRFK